jgi:hypothetical protein
VAGENCIIRISQFINFAKYYYDIQMKESEGVGRVASMEERRVVHKFRPEKVGHRCEDDNYMDLVSGVYWIHLAWDRNQW